MVKQQRGQFFTTSTLVQEVMLNLVAHDSGRVLEPSAGEGHLVKVLEEKSSNYSIDAVELDDGLTPICATPVTYSDFFSFADSADASYDLIFGNPPYVSWKGMEASSKLSAAAVKEKYSDKTNLYHLFIDRCIDLMADGGEMVFIVPKEWLYTSSARPLRRKIAVQGRVTHIVDCGEEKLFVDADVPALLIFRFVKGLNDGLDRPVSFSKNTSAAHRGEWEDRKLVDADGRWLLLHKELAKEVETWGRLGDVFSVKVGIVSGADKIFRVDNPDDFESECVRPYLMTKGVEWFIDVNHFDSFNDIPAKTAAYLEQYKTPLANRKIANFDESNWWKYGAVRNKSAMDSDAQRIYAFGRTRKTEPFFLSDETKYFGGGLLGLFVKSGTIDVTKALNTLNSSSFREVLEAMFLATGNKVSLQPSTLEDAPFPV